MGPARPAPRVILSRGVDVGLAGTVTLWTAGSASDDAYAANKGVVTLMVPLSTFRARA